uniref:Uncharacterized protein n=1 Tax=Rhodosorus marinus TaxID=101924 RepID=A0A7S2ZMV2_9RHOD|mmetsp:Transcript_25347/g.100083  ORF Transcript_25347/g.100083 Transcript_25347/m.100083 type:complete len:113 (+) Transcript_25347:204-542(+)
MAGYQTIGETTKSAAAFEEEERVVVGTGYQSGPAYPAVSEERERESSGFPSLYTAPFDLSTDSSFGERVKLVFESARPWGEFFDLNNFKLPKMSEIHERITHNSVVFFSNCA